MTEQATGGAKFHSSVWNILVAHAGADVDGHDAFVSAHCRGATCLEYRFMGSLGFGGKYRGETNTVDCYPEDMTDKRRDIIQRTNVELETLRQSQEAA